MPYPWGLVVTAFPVSMRVAITSTSVTTPPLGSLMTPLSVAVSICAKAGTPASTHSTSTANNDLIHRAVGIIPPLFLYAQEDDGFVPAHSVKETLKVLFRGSAVSFRSSGMVWRRTEICFQYRLPCRHRRATPGRLQSDENCVYFLENLGVIELHCPALLRLVVVVKDSETAWPLGIQLIAVTAPGSINKFAVRRVLRGQVERVKDE